MRLHRGKSIHPPRTLIVHTSVLQTNQRLMLYFDCTKNDLLSDPWSLFLEPDPEPTMSSLPVTLFLLLRIKGGHGGSSIAIDFFISLRFKPSRLKWVVDATACFFVPSEVRSPNFSSNLQAFYQTCLVFKANSPIYFHSILECHLLCLDIPKTTNACEKFDCNAAFCFACRRLKIKSIL